MPRHNEIHIIRGHAIIHDEEGRAALSLPPEILDYPDQWQHYIDEFPNLEIVDMIQMLQAVHPNRKGGQ